MSSDEVAALEARLLILRNRAQAAARVMQDRSKGRAASDAAGATWAETRREAEKVERELQAVRRRVKGTAEQKRTVPKRATRGLKNSKYAKKHRPWSPPTPSSTPPNASLASAAQPAGKETGPPRDAASHDYRIKTAHEISRRLKENGHPTPLGDSASGVVLVVEQPVGPRVLEALQLCLRAVGLPDAYVTYASTGLLAQELLAINPYVLVAIGAGAARDIDATSYPATRQPFSEAEPGAWFSWTQGCRGLLLPSLTPALDNEAAKRRFWRAFLTLKTLASTP